MRCWHIELSLLLGADGPPSYYAGTELAFEQRTRASAEKRDAAVAGQRLTEPHPAVRFVCLRPVAILLLFGTAFDDLEAANRRERI